MNSRRNHNPRKIYNEISAPFPYILKRATRCHDVKQEYERKDKSNYHKHIQLQYKLPIMTQHDQYEMKKNTFFLFKANRFCPKVIKPSHFRFSFMSLFHQFLQIPLK